MMIAQRLFRSSIGRKVVVAVTGTFLVLFLLGHMLGNWNMFSGQESMNHYAATLQGMGIPLWFARAGLLMLLVLHVGLTISLNLQNRAARPRRYSVRSTVRANLASRTMVLTGLILFSFIVFHLLHFTIGRIQPETFELGDAKGRHDVFRMVIYGFSNPIISASYVVSMFIVAFHLNHGIQSLFQTLGLSNRDTLPVLRSVSIGLSSVFFLGFSAVPVAVLIKLITFPAGGQ